MPAEPSERDAVLLLDMALAARDPIGFVADLDEAAFLASRCIRTRSSIPWR